MLPLYLQHDEDEIETLLSEDSDVIDSSLWETSTEAIPEATVEKDEIAISQTTSPAFRSSRCLCLVWLGLSILAGMTLTLATDHRDEISNMISTFWSKDNNDNQPMLLENASSSTTTSNWNSFNNTTATMTTSDHQQNIPNIPSEEMNQHTVDNNTTTSIDSSDLGESVLPSSTPNESKSDDNRVEEDLPHVWKDNLQYRRVCAKVYEATLCLTIRYPFDVPLQNPSVSYPDPVDERFYHLKDLILLDGPLLEQTCRNPKSTGDAANQRNVSERLFACLEEVASQYPNKDTVVAVFTRRKANRIASTTDEEEEDFYGTHLAIQRRRTVEFFRGHVVAILGASPAPYVSHCLKDLFDTCVKVNKGGGFNCNTNTNAESTDTHDREHHRRHDRLMKRHRRLQGSPSRSEQAWIRVVGYYPTDRRVEPTHLVNTTSPLVDVLQRDHTFTPGLLVYNETSSASTAEQQQTLRPLTILVEFPIAHSQTEAMITTYYDQVHYNQVEYTRKVMNLTTSREAQDGLARLGLKLARVIAFDGLPQHFPTKTGGYLPDVNNHDVTYGDKILGSTCRGPLPPNSPLRLVNDWEREAFQQNGLDMNKYYAKTWEFANQFWWLEKMHNGKSADQLDCTHPTNLGSGMTMVHKYFVQAIVDGYYESQAR